MHYFNQSNSINNDFTSSLRSYNFQKKENKVLTINIYIYQTWQSSAGHLCKPSIGNWGILIKQIKARVIIFELWLMLLSVDLGN